MNNGGAIMNGTCFFVGHRDAPQSLKRRLEDVIEYVIQKYGIGQFFVGSHGDFDRLATSAVIYLKNRYPDIKLWILLPYYHADKAIELPEGVDGTYYPEGIEFVPPKFAIIKANQKMVRECDVLISYAKYAGNAQKLTQYADHRGVRVINLAEQLIAWEEEK